MQTLMAMVDSIQPHRIALNSSLVFESPKLHAKSVFMWHVQTRHVPYDSRGVDKRWMRGNATHASSHRLRRDEHLYGIETAKMAWSIGRTCILHHSRPQSPGNGSRQRMLKNGIHGSVYGALVTGARIGDGSRAHAGIRLGCGIALVPVQKS